MLHCAQALAPLGVSRAKTAPLLGDRCRMGCGHPKKGGSIRRLDLLTNPGKRSGSLQARARRQPNGSPNGTSGLINWTETAFASQLGRRT